MYICAYVYTVVCMECLCAAVPLSLSHPRAYLDSESDGDTPLLNQLRMHLSGFIARLVLSLPRGEARVRLLTSDMKFCLFHLFGNWCGHLGLHKRHFEISRRWEGKMEETLEGMWYHFVFIFVALYFRKILQNALWQDFHGVLNCMLRQNGSMTYPCASHTPRVWICCSVACCSPLVCCWPYVTWDIVFCWHWAAPLQYICWNCPSACRRGCGIWECSYVCAPVHSQVLSTLRTHPSCLQPPPNTFQLTLQHSHSSSHLQTHYRPYLHTHLLTFRPILTPLYSPPNLSACSLYPYLYHHTVEHTTTLSSSSSPSTT